MPTEQVYTFQEHANKYLADRDSLRGSVKDFEAAALNFLDNDIRLKNLQGDEEEHTRRNEFIQNINSNYGLDYTSALELYKANKDGNQMGIGQSIWHTLETEVDPVLAVKAGKTLFSGSRLSKHQHGLNMAINDKGSVVYQAMAAEDRHWIDEGPTKEEQQELLGAGFPKEVAYMMKPETAKKWYKKGMKLLKEADKYKSSARYHDDLKVVNDYFIHSGGLRAEIDFKGQTTGGKLAGGVTQSAIMMLELVGTNRIGGGLRAEAKLNAKTALNILKSRVTAEGAARSLAQATAMPSTWSNAIKNAAPHIQVKDGELTMKKEGEPYFDALAGSIVDSAITVTAEKSGRTIGQIGGVLLQKFPTGRKLISALKEGFRKKNPLVGSKNADVQFAKEFFKRAEFHGFVEEALEERLEDAMRFGSGRQENLLPSLEEWAIELGVLGILKGGQVSLTGAATALEFATKPKTKPEAVKAIPEIEAEEVDYSRAGEAVEAAATELAATHKATFTYSPDTKLVLSDMVQDENLPAFTNEAATGLLRSHGMPEDTDLSTVQLVGYTTKGKPIIGTNDEIKIAQGGNVYDVVEEVFESNFKNMRPEAQTDLLQELKAYEVVNGQMSEGNGLERLSDLARAAAFDRGLHKKLGFKLREIVDKIREAIHRTIKHARTLRSQVRAGNVSQEFLQKLENVTYQRAIDKQLGELVSQIEQVGDEVATQISKGTAFQETIRSAAYFNPNTGKIGEGAIHAQAAANMGSDFLTKPGEKLVQEGFVTNTGRFVKGDEALKIAKESKTFKEKEGRLGLAEALGRPTAEQIVAKPAVQLTGKSTPAATQQKPAKPGEKPGQFEVYRAGDIRGELINFGTESAARKAAVGRDIVKGTLTINNPATMIDSGRAHDQNPVALAEDLVRGNNEGIRETLIPVVKNIEKIKGKEAAFKAITDTLKNHGYDGITYSNVNEDIGSTSYIALTPDQFIKERLGKYEILGESRTQTEIEKLRQEVEFWKGKAQTDRLTGLTSKDYTAERLPEVLKQSSEAGKPVSIVFMDITNFKALNEMHGHEKADTALAAIGEVIRDVTRKDRGDELAFSSRYGGDELLLTLPGATALNADRIAQRIKQKVDKKLKEMGMHQVVQDKQVWPISLNEGIVTQQPGELLDASELIAKADLESQKRRAELNKLYGLPPGARFAKKEEAISPDATSASIVRTEQITKDIGEFKRHYNGEESKLWSREKASKIASGLIERGWRVTLPNEAITTSSIYFGAEASDGRTVSIRISDHGTTGGRSKGLRGRGPVLDVAVNTKISDVIKHAESRAMLPKTGGESARSELSASIVRILPPLSQGLTPVTVTSKKGMKAQTIEGVKDIGSVISDVMTPISTAIYKISPELFRRLRLFEGSYRKAVKKDLDKVESFVKKMSKLPKDIKAKLDLYLKNGDISAFQPILEKYGMNKDYLKVQSVLNKIYDDAKKSGVDLGYTKIFMPRSIKDIDEFRTFLAEKRNSKYWSAFEGAIKSRERQLGRKLEGKERTDYIAQLIRGYGANRIEITAQGHTKGRVLKELTPEQSDYYYSSEVALAQYIQQMREAIEARKLFGLSKDIQVEDAIGEYVHNLIDQQAITPQQERELVELFTARFTSKSPRSILRKYRNFEYIETLGSPLTALTQLEDMGVAWYRAGLLTGLPKVLSNFAKAALNKSDIKLVDLGIYNIAAEMTDPTQSAKILDFILNITGFKYLDRIGKETTINTIMQTFQKQAKKPTKELRRRMERVFGDKANEVIAKMANGVVDSDIQYLAFSELLDIQPVALSELPKKYLNMSDGKVLYMLKTFMLRRLDMVLNETVRLIKVDPVQGIINGMRLTAALMVMGVATDELKDWIMGRQTSLSDQATDNLLRVVGLSRYDIYQTEMKGGWKAVTSKVAPPFKIIDSAGRDVRDLVKGDYTGSESLASVPLIGKILYWRWGKGAKKEKKKQRKDRPKTLGKILRKRIGPKEETPRRERLRIRQ